MLRVRGQTRTWVYVYTWGGKAPATDARYSQAKCSCRMPAPPSMISAARQGNRAKTAEIWKAKPVPTIRPVTLGETVIKYLAARDPETARSDRLRMTKRGFAEVKRYLSEYWKPLHGMGLGEVTRCHVTNRIDELAAEKGAITADRARTALSGLYSWSLQGDDKLSNPIMGSRRHGDNDPRERVLSDAELVAVWNASDPANDYGRIVRLLLLTAVVAMKLRDYAGRRFMRWEPQERQRFACRARGRRTVSLILCRYPARRSHPTGQRNYTRPGACVWARCWRFQWIQPAKAALDTKAAVAEHWVLHDLRRTVRTRVGSLGVQPHIGEAILNHLPPQLMRTYERNAYETEKRAALERWATSLQTILAPGAATSRLLLKSGRCL